MSFEKFDLSEELYLGLKDLRYESPTPIQDECIPLIMEGKDVIGAAQTGTGKTGAFVIPLIQKILNDRSGKTQALILSPTRELAQQIDEQIFAIGYHCGATSATVTGGSDFSRQVKAIRAGVDIVVATPGRLIDQMKVLEVNFADLKYLVLDEADRMLDMGFLPDVMKIIKQLPEERQTMLFSATMVEEVQRVVDQVMKDPVEVEFEVSKPVDSVDQQIYFVHPKEKLKLFEQIFDADKYETALIFTATKRGTDELHRLLEKRDVSAVSMHGDRSQEERNEALRTFKNRISSVMVATDVLSRGIDIDDVSLIVNYDVPNNPEDYIHRIGRTGRYNKTGTAITFVSNKDKKYYYAIKNVVGDQLTVKDASSRNGNETKSEPDQQKQQKSQKSKTYQKSQRPPESELKERPTRGGGKKKKDSSQKSSRSESENGEGSSSKGKGDSGPEQKESKGSKREVKQSHDQTQSPSSGREKIPYPEEIAENIPQEVKKQEVEIFQPEIVEKAVNRNRRSLKPAKGVWGIIKSFIPKIFG